MGIKNHFQDESPVPYSGDGQVEKVCSNTYQPEYVLTTTSTSLSSTTSTHFTSSPKPTSNASRSHKPSLPSPPRSLANYSQGITHLRCSQFSPIFQCSFSGSASASSSATSPTNASPPQSSKTPSINPGVLSLPGASHPKPHATYSLLSSPSSSPFQNISETCKKHWLSSSLLGCITTSALRTKVSTSGTSLTHWVWRPSMPAPSSLSLVLLDQITTGTYGFVSLPPQSALQSRSSTCQT